MQTGSATPNLDHRLQLGGDLDETVGDTADSGCILTLVTSIVIPAHNEARVIGRLLAALLADTEVGDVPDIVVVCNGCTDDTAAIAGAHPGVRVVEIPLPSKHAALRAGDEHARGFPRLYVDADVELGGGGVRALAGAVADGSGVLAAAPARHLPMTGCAWPVRAYYRVWQRLPAVREGLFGRGVIAVSREGHARLAALPPLMADDLAASLAFSPAERRVVDGTRVTVHPPRTWADLIRRRVRAETSSAQLEAQQAQGNVPLPPSAGPAPSSRAAPPPSPGAAPAPAAPATAASRTLPSARTGQTARTGDSGPTEPTAPTGTESAGSAEPAAPTQPTPPVHDFAATAPSARTTPADLRRVLRAEPWLLPHMAVFLTVAVVARRTSRKAVRSGDFGTWPRDESSRTG